MPRRRASPHLRTPEWEPPKPSELTASVDNGDPEVLANTPTSWLVEFFRATHLTKSGRKSLRSWSWHGHTVPLRANAVAVLSKLAEPADTDLIISVLHGDDKVRRLSLAVEVCKLMHYDWDTCWAIAENPAAAPDPYKLAKALSKDAVNEDDAESRWCGAILLVGLAPVLGK